MGRNSFRGPKFFNVDAFCSRASRLLRGSKPELQFQFFNIFNHVNFDLPDSSVDKGSSGSISNIAYGSTMRQLTFGAVVRF